MKSTDNCAISNGKGGNSEILIGQCIEERDDGDQFVM